MANELLKAEVIQEVAQLSLQGHKNTEIARMKGISETTVHKYIREWEKYIKEKAQSDPDLFDKVLENSLKFIESYDLMLRNAWDVHDESKEAGVHATRLSAIKLIREISSEKARLHQLLGPRQETNYLEKAKRAEKVNEVLSEILKETVRDCSRCEPLVWDRLRQAFSMMEQDIDDEVTPDFDMEALSGGEEGHD